MNHGMKQNFKFTALVGSIALLTSCAATQVAMEHHSLQTSTKLSETVFLDPVPKTQKTVYIAVKNTSDQPIDNMGVRLKEAFNARGFKVVGEPNRAHYLLQANILQIGKMSAAASKTALGGGYGSALAGGLVGVGLGSLTHSSSAMIGGGIAGGLVGLAADSLVKAVNYTMVTDVQISERVGRGSVSEQFNASLKNGSSSGTQQTVNKKTDFQRYRTRVVSNADKVNLSFEKARPALEEGLVKTLVGIF
jgi:outer membrane lipoprotein SlyB